MSKQKSMGEFAIEFLNARGWGINNSKHNRTAFMECMAHIIAEHERRKRAKDIKMCNSEIIAMQVKCKRAKRRGNG